jgi:diaminohydroxyphosphoribosylaminopyrimidine deaminase/5-amino-6-(5-phosphoribosylamino)uracil reductase
VQSKLHKSPADSKLRSLLAELAEEARACRFEVAPNPCVGAALLDADGTELARGVHRVWGGPHAEMACLAAAEEAGHPRETWDTLVVTLEPCSSDGKTPPCTEAVLASGVRRLVIGDTDPDARHRGRGLEILAERGVEVALLPGPASLRRVAPHFLSWTDHDRVRRPRPWTIAKWAQTRTGQLVPPEDVGEGRWISGPAARSEVQVLRGRVEAILTGVGTVLADDPRLTVRAPGDVTRPPRRVVLDSHLRTPPEARLFSEPGDAEGAGAVSILCIAGGPVARHRALGDAGAEVVGLRPGDDGSVSLRAVMEWLFERGCRRVLVEAGPSLLGALVERDFVDQVRVYTGAVNGGRGPTLAERLRPERLKDLLHREIGEDAVLEAFL